MLREHARAGVGLGSRKTCGEQLESRRGDAFGDCRHAVLELCPSQETVRDQLTAVASRSFSD
jgi:hypothetical protein